MRSRHLLRPLARAESLLQSRMTRPHEEIVIREYRPGDEVGILALFNRTFAAVDPGFVPRDLDTWRWLYQQNPSGRRIVLAVARDGRVVAQYAGLGQRVSIEGRRVRANQAIDSMSDPDRTGLQHPGPFVRAGRVFAQRFGGRAPSADAFMWGLPEPAAWRVGRRFLGYQVVRNLNRLVGDPLACGAQGDPRAAGVAAVEVAEVPAGVERLFERVAAGRAALVVRDRAHLSWRYLARPGVPYRIAVVPGPDEVPLGLAVYRAGGFEGQRTGLLCDWLVPADGSEEAARSSSALRAWALGAARADGLALTAVFPEPAPEFAGFQRAGFRVRPTRRVLVARSYRRDVSVDWLRANLFMTLGDTDLV